MRLFAAFLAVLGAVAGASVPATLELAACADTERTTFSWSSPGVLKHNASGLCVDASLPQVGNALQLGDCSTASAWEHDEANKQIRTTATFPCRKAEHGTSCYLCLDLFDGHTDGPIDGFDCKGPSDGQQSNQQWRVSSTAAGSATLSPAVAPSVCVSAPAPPPAPSPAAPVTVDPSAADREFFGVGGLSNSDAPWLRDYEEGPRAAILDALFKPNHVASLNILKVEIGGDGSSTIVTESSHMHDANASHASFQRGWEWWLLDEAKARNPSIRTAALAWTAPAWLGTYYSNATVDYLVAFVQGALRERGHRFDFLGLRNESPEPPAWWIVALREALDAAGFADVVLFGSDNHNFDILSVLASSPAATKALGIIGVHEPLRNAESVPAAATALGKPIWASEAYTTYSDSNGAGCWARVSNWGPVLGNVSAQIAWNLVQSYPGALGYTGHGLMWAEHPWSGHFVVNPPLWASAHYTQMARSGWRYLRNGRGSGLLNGGPGASYVTMVPPPGVGSAGVFATVVQAMSYSNSQCFKDTHPAFDVPASQNVTFVLKGDLRSPKGGLQLWKSCFAPGDDPENPTKSVFFQRQSPDPVPAGDGTVTLVIDVDCVYTLASRDPDSQAAQHGEVGPIAPSAPFPSKWSDSLAVEVDGRPPFFLDQAGVFEGATLPSLPSAGPFLTQAVPAAPLAWHSAHLTHPATFVGQNRTNALSVSATVRPATAADGGSEASFAGVGIGLVRSSSAAFLPGSFFVFANGTACFGAPRSINCAASQAQPTPGGWFNLELTAAADGTSATASVNGAPVLKSLPLPANGGASWPGLVSSFDRAAFKDLSIASV